jgi:hypothetical protein
MKKTRPYNIVRQIGILAIFLCALLSSPVFAAEAQLLRHVSAKECGKCHKQIYSQWKKSMHAKSTALKDPIHGALYKELVGDPKAEGLKKKGKYPICLQCHAPVAAKDGKTKLDAMTVYSEGINCVACHSITAFKGTKKPGGGLRLGMLAYEYSDTELQGPNSMDVHPTGESKEIVGNSAIFKTNAICLGCHDQRRNFNNVTLCRTGGEISEASGSTDCQLCHMPVVNGKADHSLMGGHSSKMVSKGLLMTMEVNKKESTLDAVVTLKNKLPHNFPTGAPFRNVYIKLTAYDKTGAEVWKSSQTHPVKDDKKAMLMYALGDAKGKPAAPPKATQVLYDSRLKPHETRTLTYNVPAKDVAQIKAVAYYDLLLPPMKKKFAKQIPENLRKSSIIAATEVEL